MDSSNTLTPTVEAVSGPDVPTLTPAQQERAAQLFNEGLIGFRAVVQLLPRVRGGELGYRSLLRWIIKGRCGTRLEAVRIGGQWYTSRAALVRFAARLTTGEGIA